MCGIEKTQPDYLVKTIRAYEETASLYASVWFNELEMEPFLDSFLDFLEASDDILDAGCGPGRDVQAMTIRGFRTVGIDLCRSMLAEARLRVPSGIFRQMDMRCLRYPPETFDGVWACVSLNHLKARDVSQALREFARVLKPEGMLGLVIEEGQDEFFDHSGRYWRFYTATDFRKLIAESGFRIVEERVKHCEKQIRGGKCHKKQLQILVRKTKITPRLIEDGYEYDCVLCPADRFKLHKQIGISSASSILWGNDEFYVLPDAAPLVEGHLLMVTTDHYMCFGACPTALTTSVHSTRRAIRQLLWKAYEKPTLFLEHGPARLREAGSCINHAHWHCLPVSLPVREAVDNLIGSGQMAASDTLQFLHESGQSYIYVEEDTDRGWVYPVDVVPSQFLRQVIVSLLWGQDSDWRWQTICSTDRNKAIYEHTLEHLLPLADQLWS